MKFTKLKVLALACPVLLSNCDSDEQAAVIRGKDQRIAQLESSIEALTVNVRVLSETQEKFEGIANSALESCNNDATDTDIKKAISETLAECKAIGEKLPTIVNPSTPVTPPPVTPPPVTPPPVTPPPVTPPPITPPPITPPPVTPPPVTSSGIDPNKPPPPEFDGNDDDFQKQALLAAAYIACQVYSAGTCSFIIAAVGLQLGMSSDEVREEMKPSFDKLGAEITDKGILIDGPDGKPIKLTIKRPADVLKAIQDFSSLSENDRKDPCNVIGVFSNIAEVKSSLGGSPFGYESEQLREQVLQIVRGLDLAAAPYFEAIPVRGKGNLLSCE